MGSQATRDQDRRQSAVAQDQYGRGAWRQIGAVRELARSRRGARLRAVAIGRRSVRLSAARSGGARREQRAAGTALGGDRGVIAGWVAGERGGPGDQGPTQRQRAR